MERFKMRKQMNIKSMTVLLICYCLVYGAGVAAAQQEITNAMGELFREQKNIISRLESAPWPKQGKEEGTGMKTYICPKDGRAFQLAISPSNEIEKGMLSIYCPYDGFQFYPSSATEVSSESGADRIRIAQEQKGEWYLVRSPRDGREFKVRVDVKELLNGNAIFTSPFDGTQFRFAPEILDYTDESRNRPGMVTVVSPDTGKNFRAVVADQNQILTDPFTGRKGPAFQFRVDSGKRETDGAAETTLSRIETMFVTGETDSLRKEITQFGYSFFPSQEEVLRWKEQKALAEQSSMAGLGAVAGGMKGGGGGQNVALSGASSDRGDQSASGFMGGMFSSVLASQDYVLGPGDVLIVYLWGKMQQSFPLLIDAEGKVFLPQLGPIQLAGISFAQAEGLIKERLSEKFTNFEISISMGRIRTIPVFVFGEAKLPGVHKISAQSTLMQALFTAGGPTKMGSLRKIKLIRGQKEYPIDLYKMLIGGDKSVDIKIQENDVLLIPPIGDVAAVKGSVKRPAIYELSSAIPLNELIEMAGGLSARGYAHRIHLERVVDHERVVVEDLEFSGPEEMEEQTKKIEIYEGDSVSIFPISPIRYNYVSIEGSVLYPGDYEWKEGMSVKTLIEKAGGFAPRTYLGRADLIRGARGGFEEIPVHLEEFLQGDQSQDLKLQQWDRLKVYDLDSVYPNRFVAVQGAVRKPGSYPLSERMRISDLLFKAGGLEAKSDLESAELFRGNSKDGKRLIRVNLREVLQDKGGEADFLLQEEDQLFVRVLPGFWEEIRVVISGEITYPGEFVLQKGERLSSLLERAGGFTEYAYPEGVVFRRAAIERIEGEIFQKFLQGEQQVLLQEQSTLVSGFSMAQTEARSKLVEFQNQRASQTEQSNFLSGRHVIHLSQAEKLKGSQDDIILQDGDSLFIPPVPSYVLVVNNRQRVMVVTYEEGKGVEHYIGKAGGFQRYDDKRNIYVLTAGGELKTRFVKAMPVKPGDTIIIPQKIQYKTPVGLTIKDTISTLYQVGLGAIAVASID